MHIKSEIEKFVKIEQTNLKNVKLIKKKRKVVETHLTIHFTYANIPNK